MKKSYVLLILGLLLLVSVVIIYFGILLPYRSYQTFELKISDINAAFTNKNYQEVIELSDKHLLEYPDDSDVLVLKGIAIFNIAFLSAYTKNDIDKNAIWDAIHTIRKGISIGISNEMKKYSYYILGKCYYYLSDQYLYTAIELLNKTLSEGYEKDDLFEFLAFAYRELNNPEDAIQVLRNRIEQNPKLSYYLLLLDIYLDEDFIEEAIQTLLIAESYAITTQEKIAIRLIDARIAIKNNNFTYSINVLSDIIQTYPQSVEAHYYLGNIYEKQGDISKARYEWRIAYKMLPHWDKVINKLDNNIEVKQ